MPSTLLGRRREKQAKLSAPVALTNDENDGILPTDVLYEVLLRVPAKELCRLRVVCRSWRSLTSDPEFARAHASRHPLLVAGMWNNNEVHLLDLSCCIVRRLQVPEGVHALTTDLGLLCCTSQVIGVLSFVLDPVSGEVVSTLPYDSIDVDLQLDGIELRLVQDYRGSSPSLLGHVPSTGEYKVLRTNGYRTGWDGGLFGQELITQTCDVITVSNRTVSTDGSGAMRWRARPCPSVGGPLSSCLRRRVVLNGVAYFLRRPTNDNYYYHVDIKAIEPDAIFAFDLATEEWRPNTLRGPLSSNSSDTEHKFSQERESLQLCVLDGCLVTAHHKKWDCSMDLWFLEDNDEIDKGLWNKRYSIQCVPGCTYRHSFRPPHPLHVLEDGRIVMWEPERPESPVMVLGVYNPRTNKYTNLTSIHEYCSVAMHLGSLLCSPVLQS